MSEPNKMEPHAFVAAVLWIRGHSIGEVAKTVGWTPGQVRGFVGRQFKDNPRAAMTDDERQALLDEFKANRADGGRLRDEHFVAGRRAETPRPQMTIAEKKRLEKESPASTTPAGPDLNTRAGRKEAKRLQKEAEKIAAARQAEQEKREAGHAERRGVAASALDYLLAQRILRDPETTGPGGKSSEEQRRHEAGVRLRSYIEGTRIGGLGAIDYERATMGTGGGPKLSLAAYKLQCINALGEIRQMMSKTDFLMIEAVVDQDNFIWETAPPATKIRARIFDGIRKLLDVVAVHERLMEHKAFHERWDEDLPEIEDRYTRSKAIAGSERIAEILEGAR